MKIAVINFSGNVGKSTIARQLLAPRIPGADVIAIETINSDGHDDGDALKGKQFGELQEAMTLMDAAVVDIGASNVEDVVTLMKQYRGSHEDFDYFVVPTVPEKKQQRDTIATIRSVAQLGVPAKKIRMIFNMVEPDDDPARVFASLFDYHAADKCFTLRPDAVLRTNEVYARLNGGTGSLREILDDPTDYKAKIKEAADQDEKMRFAQLLSIKRLAAGVVEEHDAVFKTLFK
jgi:hypothetical protein